MFRFARGFLSAGTIGFSSADLRLRVGGKAFDDELAIDTFFCGSKDALALCLFASAKLTGFPMQWLASLPLFNTSNSTMLSSRSLLKSY